jgi:hypothetical protein
VEELEHLSVESFRPSIVASRYVSSSEVGSRADLQFLIVECLGNGERALGKCPGFNGTARMPQMTAHERRTPTLSARVIQRPRKSLRLLDMCTYLFHLPEIVE